MHSKFWIPEYFFTKQWDVNSPEYLLIMASIRRSIAGFVKIVTNESIPVVFSSDDQSYTDGKSIVISATGGAKDIDSTVGLALHEASHILLSKPLFEVGNLINYLQSGKPVGVHSAYMRAESITVSEAVINFNKRIPIQVLLSDFDSIVIRKNLISHIVDGHTNFFKVWSDLHHIVNVIEDRRIDSWMYDNLGGYRPYYDSLYDRYWHNDEITNAMAAGVVVDKFGVSHMMDEPTFRNYKFWFTNMTNPEFDTSKAPPGMDEIVEIVDLDNIRRLDMTDFDTRKTRALYEDIARGGRYSRTSQILDQMPLVYTVAMKVLKVIYDNVEIKDDYKTTNQNVNKFGNYTPKKASGTGDSDNFKVHDHISEKPKDQKKAEDAFDAVDIQSKMADNSIPKDKLTYTQMNDMGALEESNAEIRHGDYHGGKVPMTMYRRVNSNIINSDGFSFKGDSSKAFVKGHRMGRLLAHRLAVIQDESTTVFNRQKQGRLDRRMVASIGSGDYNIFNSTMVEKYDPVMVDLSIDASSSMKFGRWDNAYAMAVSLAVAADINRKMRVRINIRASHEVAIIYDSKVNSIAHLRTISSGLGAYGSTPEGLAFQSILKELLEEVDNTRRFFVNLSDGRPEVSTPFGFYTGPSAYEHTRQQVREIEKAGISVLSYLIDGHDDDMDVFRQMYGPAATMIDTNNIGQIAKTLNKLFLKGGR